jgi:dTDP-4-amino-4,6-dideoxygalactose transaminase
MRCETPRNDKLYIASQTALPSRLTIRLWRLLILYFLPDKNLGTIGDGGAVTINDSALADKLRWSRQYGRRGRHISDFKDNCLDELQAAIVRVKLPFLAVNNKSRCSLASAHEEALSDLPIQTPAPRPRREPVYHPYPIRVKERDASIKHRSFHDIPEAKHYPAAVHHKRAYAAPAQPSPPLVNADALVPEVLRLPLHAYLGENEENTRWT